MRLQRRAGRAPVLLSAHRCGAGDDRALENTRVALDRALALDVDFVEFDVRRCGDGTLVCFHDDWLWVGERRRDLADETVRAVPDWADVGGLDLLVGLSLGRRVRGLPLRRKVPIRLSELRPHTRYLRSRANLVVAKHTIARAGVAAFARRRGLPLLVWTVDTEESLRYWTHPGRAWLVASNQPALALTVREQERRRLERRRRLGGSRS